MPWTNRRCRPTYSAMTGSATITAAALCCAKSTSQFEVNAMKLSVIVLVASERSMVAAKRNSFHDQTDTITPSVSTTGAAIGAMGAIEAVGLRIPEDVSVVGFDDIPFAATMHPPLTTVAQPTYELGRAAARTLFDLIDRGPEAGAPAHLLMDCALIVRGTTGRCAPASAAGPAGPAADG